MKNIKIILSLLCVAMVFFACEDDYERKPGGLIKATAPMLHPISGTDYIFTQSMEALSNPFLFRLSWDRPRFSFPNDLPAEVTDVYYTIEAGVLGLDFKNAFEVTKTESLFYDVYTEKMNSLMHEMFGESETEQHIELRIKVNYTDEKSSPGEAFSNAISFTFKPYIYYTPLLKQLTETNFILEQSNAEALLFKSEWSSLDFGAIEKPASEVSYVLEIGQKNENFKKTSPLATTKELSANITTNKMNEAIRELLGKYMYAETNIEMRIKAIYGNNEEQYSNVIPLTVTTYAPGPKVVKWKATGNEWSDMAVYCWGMEEYFGGWPGKKVVADEYGWYSVTIPGDLEVHLIINNDGKGNQFDMPYPTRTEQYNVDLKAGTFTRASEWSITLRWKQVADNWTGMALYCWGGSPKAEPFGGWPGKVVTPDANGWYSATVAPGQTFGNAILNNAGAGAQFDINLPITTDLSLEVTGSSYKVVVHN